MLKWNAAKVRNLTSMEVSTFIIARVLIRFAAGVLAAHHFPQVGCTSKTRASCTRNPISHGS